MSIAMADRAQPLLTFRDVSTLLDLDESRLRYWSQTGLVGPSARSGGRQFFTFPDLIQVKAAKELVDRGVPVVRVQKALGMLRKAMPDLDRPLERLRVCSDGERILVLDQEAAFESTTGQLLMEFALAPLGCEAAQVLGLPFADGAGNQEESAYASFASGLAAEDDGDDAGAECFYLRALELDPHLAAAHTNIGNIFHRRGRRGDARERYELALALDPDQAEARFNLANLLDEVGEHELALAEYRRALASAADFADAHFNLALALERAGQPVEARVHYLRYVELDPGPNDWVDAARAALTRLP